ncbi:hypothetical protein E3J85_01770 [Patescibacteria group bacterium]|nr:MAG: hypothetical protein E3J85_01770 [Patescibacteria group bacterium]
MVATAKLRLTKFFKHPFWKDKLILVFVLVHLGLNIAQWLIVYLGLRGFRGYSVPLHYTILGGVDTLGYWYQLFALPLLALIIGIVNVTLAISAYKREQLLSYFLTGIGVLLQVLMFIISLAFIELIRG